MKAGKGKDREEGGASSSSGSTTETTTGTQNGHSFRDGNGTVYSAVRIIGNGSFGVVYQVQEGSTGEVFAIKKVLQDKRFKNRELQIMQSLTHPCIVALRNSFFTHEKDEVFLNLVLEYLPETVYKSLRRQTRLKQRLPVVCIKSYMYQLARSLAFLHMHSVCHRDIKPQNLLVNPETHVLKLCDFGSAKVLRKSEPNISYICSRYYRAPELIFGSTDYSSAIDVWSFGCVLAELLLGQTAFPGESNVDQLVEIIKVLGTPSRAEIQAMNQNYTEFKFPSIKAHPWSKVFRNQAPDDAVDLCSKLLVYCPEDRLTPLEACCHPFFDELRDPNCVFPGGTRPDDIKLFYFTEEETERYGDVIGKLVPEHAKNVVGSC